MKSHSFHQVRWRLRLALVLCVVGAFPDAADAVTFRVGLDAGQAGSVCQFDNMQTAINALPNDSDLHTIQLQAGDYSRPIDTLRVTAGRRLRVITSFRAGSGCTEPETSARARIAPPTSTLESGRQIVALGGADLELVRVIVSSGSNGGLLQRDSRIVLRDVRVDDQRTPAQASGAGAVVEGGSLQLIDSSFIDNHAGANGGAIFCSRGVNNSALVTVADGSAFMFNRARHGGAIYLFRGCTLQVHDTPLFFGNVAAQDGGAIGTEPVTAGTENMNAVEIDDAPRFMGNEAGGDGGAMAIDAGNALVAEDGSLPEFGDNTAGGAGGALFVTGAGPSLHLAGARFQDNSAGTEGGAIATRARVAMLLADCAVGEPDSEDYCALFRGNSVASQAGAIRRGGTLSISDGGALIVEGYAFRDSRGPRTLNGDSGGVIAAVGAGSLHLANALVFDSGPGLQTDSHLFLVQRDGSATFVFNTMVDAAAGSTVFIQPGGTVRMAGNIIAGNAAGVINNGGTLTGTCNNVQLGTAPAPVDPGFVATPQGRYRLAIDSAMRNGALGCDPSRLPPGFRAPSLDLLGRDRIEAGEQPMAIDLGAIEFRPRDERIFSNGFESAPR
jgi:predicted outer membrane repeat protein